MSCWFLPCYPKKPNASFSREPSWLPAGIFSSKGIDHFAAPLPAQTTVHLCRHFSSPLDRSSLRAVSCVNQLHVSNTSLQQGRVLRHAGWLSSLAAFLFSSLATTTLSVLSFQKCANESDFAVLSGECSMVLNKGETAKLYFWCALKHLLATFHTTLAPVGEKPIQWLNEPFPELHWWLRVQMTFC